MGEAVRISNAKPGHSSFTSMKSAQKLVQKRLATFLPDGTLRINYDSNRMKRQKQPRIESARQYGNMGSGSMRPMRVSGGPTPEEIHWRESVLIRDEYRCVDCGSTENLEADHIKPRKLYPDLKYDVSNGRTLCHDCHVKTETYGGKVHRLASVEVG